MSKVRTFSQDCSLL